MCLKNEENSNPLATCLMFCYVWICKKKEPMLQKIIQTDCYLSDYEIEIAKACAGDGLAAVCVQVQNQKTMYYTLTDNLGSIQYLINENGNVAEEYSFDAWGRLRNPQNWTYNNLQTPTLLTRGFTGHEHLYEIGLINMNGRMYDPVVGRFLSADPYIQMPEYSQNYNRYSYCLNNPLKFTDPSGEICLIDDLIVGGIAFAGGYLYTGITTGDFGKDALKTGAIWAGTALITLYTGGVALSPTAAGSLGINTVIGNAFAGLCPGVNIPVSNNFSINISPFIMVGSNQYGMGVSLSATYTEGNFSATIGARFGDYSRNYGTSGSSSEDVLFSALGYDDGTSGIMYSTSTYSGGNSQTLGSIHYRHNDFSFSYQNDWFFGLPADGGDRYRTAAARLSWKEFSIGTNLFTGDPGLEEQYRKTEKINGRDTYIAQNGNDPNKYRAGIFYIGYNNITIGRNSESIRHALQNRFVHDFVLRGKSPHFKVLPVSPTGYYQFGSQTPYTLW